MGIPPMRFSFIKRKASAITASSCKVTGSMIIPLSLRLTLRTCSACCSTDIFLCKIPIPPSLASAMANVASVTVSIAAESKGMFNVICFVSCVEIFTSRGRTSEYAGTSNTSSKVNPSPKNFVEFPVLVAICEDRKKINMLALPAQCI